MHVAISARVFEYPSGGAVEVLRGLLPLLLKNENIKITLYYASAKCLGMFPQATEKVLETKSRLWYDFILLPQALRRDHPDVVLFPGSTMPWGINYPSVAILLDLGYFEKSLKMYKPLESIFMRFFIAYTLKHAAGCAAISETTLKHVRALFPQWAHKVSTVYLAVPEIYRDKPQAAQISDFKTSHGLPEDFLLYSGNISPRKNLKRLLQALALCPEELCLVMTGGVSWKSDLELWLQELGLESRVIRLGHIKDEEMPLLVASARAMVFPSLFEGFGLPILEAQAMACPLLCSNISSLPEVAGEGAEYFEPTDVESIRDAMLKVWNHEALRQELVIAGRKNESRFSWQQSADKVLEILAKAAEQGGLQSVLR